MTDIAPPQGVDATSLRGVALGDGILQVRYRQDQNVDGGTATSGSDQKYPLNEVTHNGIAGASMESSVITLPAGTYFLTGWLVFRGAGIGRTQIWLDGLGAPIVSGLAGTCVTDSNEQNFLQGVFTLAAETALEIQYRVANTKTTTGLGADANFNADEVYGDFIFMRMTP